MAALGTCSGALPQMRSTVPSSPGARPSAPAPAALRRCAGAGTGVKNVTPPDATGAARRHVACGAIADFEEQELDQEAMNQYIREGHFERDLVDVQAGKADGEQASILDYLPRFVPGVDMSPAVTIVGCGPAGLALAAQLGQRGAAVTLVGHDAPFVNNYGVWVDEFKAIGLEHTIDAMWPDTVCYMGEADEFKVGRAYGRVSRRLLRDHLLKECAEAGVRFLPGEATDIEAPEGSLTSTVTTADGARVESRLVTVAAGAAAAKFLRHEEGPLSVASQTAYGIEVEIEGYADAYDPEVMLFMDFRRLHSGLWEGTSTTVNPGTHPNADPMWGSETEVPSFLYAMPLGGKRVFLEETCLVAKPALPFETLKRRLYRRLENMNMKVGKVYEEEWSYIPVGGPLPVGDQRVTAFGASANLVHPATGYSITRSLSEAPRLAEQMVAALNNPAVIDVDALSGQVWEGLWPLEKRRRAAFHVFGMELLAKMNLAATSQFFNTFFALPDKYWRGFLASELGSGDLVVFALLTFVLAPMGIRMRLMGHLFTDPSGAYLIDVFTRALREPAEGEEGGEQR